MSMLSAVTSSIDLSFAKTVYWKILGWFVVINLSAMSMAEIEMVITTKEGCEFTFVLLLTSLFRYQPIAL